MPGLEHPTRLFLVEDTDLSRAVWDVTRLTLLRTPPRLTGTLKTLNLQSPRAQGLESL